MDQASLTHTLAGLPIGLLEYHPQIGSTNDEAARLVQAGCPDLSLIVADEQTAGRGRMNRRWFTPPGAALAFSLVLLPHPDWLQADIQANAAIVPRLTALGALAVCQVLQDRYDLAAQIKWPNDVLVKQRKLAGVLVETSWEGDQFSAAILGIGLNIAPLAVPPVSDLLFPATSLAGCLTDPLEEVDRLSLLRDILEQILFWRKNISSVEFMQAWQARLALRGEWVWIVPAQTQVGLPQAGASPRGEKYRILDLEMDGSLRVESESGVIQRFLSADIHLRPL